MKSFPATTALHKIGGLAATMLGLLFVGYILLLTVVLPGQGIGPGALNDPDIGIRFLANSPLASIIDFIYLGIAVVFPLITLALAERLGTRSPAVVRLVVLAGSTAAALFLTYALLSIVGAPFVVSVFEQDPQLGRASYSALKLTANGLSAAALFAAGWTALLTGWLARTEQRLPAFLCYTLIAAGISMVLSFVFLPIGLLGVLLAPVWSIWLGLVLLRHPANAAGSVAMPQLAAH